MKYSICQNRDALRRMTKARVYRAQLKQTATASASAHGRSSAVHADESALWHILDAQSKGRASK